MRGRAAEVEDRPGELGLAWSGPTPQTRSTSTAEHERHGPTETLGADAEQTERAGAVAEVHHASPRDVVRARPTEGRLRGDRLAIDRHAPARISRRRDEDASGVDRADPAVGRIALREHGAGAGQVGANEGLEARLLACIRRRIGEQRPRGDPGGVLVHDGRIVDLERAQVELPGEAADERGGSGVVRAGHCSGTGALGHHDVPHAHRRDHAPQPIGAPCRRGRQRVGDKLLCGLRLVDPSIGEGRQAAGAERVDDAVGERPAGKRKGGRIADPQDALVVRPAESRERAGPIALRQIPSAATDRRHEWERADEHRSPARHRGEVSPAEPTTAGEPVERRGARRDGEHAERGSGSDEAAEAVERTDQASVDDERQREHGRGTDRGSKSPAEVDPARDHDRRQHGEGEPERERARAGAEREPQQRGRTDGMPSGERSAADDEPGTTYQTGAPRQLQEQHRERGCKRSDERATRAPHAAPDDRAEEHCERETDGDEAEQRFDARDHRREHDDDGRVVHDRTQPDPRADLPAVRPERCDPAEPAQARQQPRRGAVREQPRPLAALQRLRGNRDERVADEREGLREPRVERPRETPRTERPDRQRTEHEKGAHQTDRTTERHREHTEHPDGGRRRP